MSTANNRRWGAYLHLPWCRVRCPYCAFNISTTTPRWNDWLMGIRAEWAVRQPYFSGAAQTLYLGGGTPSLAPPEVLKEALAILPTQPDVEISIEVNPGDLTTERLEDWKALGVHRLSLGVQTFNPRFARILARAHTTPQAHELVQMVRSAGLRSWNVDVMFGLPEQTPDDFEQDLQAIVNLSPPHVSLYGLTFEPGTPLTAAHTAGRLSSPSPEHWREMYDRAVALLEQHGIHRYEVSNFARSGHRSRHNESVWRAGAYVGLGPGAHGFTPDGVRTESHPGFEDWLSDPGGKVSVPTPAQAAIDFLLSTLRHVDGTSRAAMESRTGYRVSERTLTPLLRGGVIEVAEGHIRLTNRGFPLADGIVAKICDGLRVGP